MKATIERTQNGFIVSWPDELDDGSPNIQQRVFEDADIPYDDKHADDYNELIALQHALYEVKNQLGYSYSKHNKQNIIIGVD